MGVGPWNLKTSALSINRPGDRLTEREKSKKKKKNARCSGVASCDISGELRCGVQITANRRSGARIRIRRKLTYVENDKFVIYSMLQRIPWGEVLHLDSIFFGSSWTLKRRQLCTG
jgi:hypothetical protein